MGDNEYGTIITVGPTRMNYRGVIPLLEYIAKNIKNIICSFYCIFNTEPFGIRRRACFNPVN